MKKPRRSTVLGRWRIVDEMTAVSGDGDADREPHGTLTGEIRFLHGDEMPFTARPG
jgi:hypothetical protein